MQPIVYDITQFQWNSLNNTFYADAPHLIGVLPDGSWHPEAFPSDKKQFTIKNYKTDGFRRFRFVEELNGDYLFVSEDNIRCVICVDLDRFEEGFFF